jgi:XRE family transcriptional regulator, regulator of sulfur utilization
MKHIMTKELSSPSARPDVLESVIASWSPKTSAFYETVSSEFRHQVNMRQDIGRQVREARQRAGFTQSELSIASGILQPEISRVERGFANPTLDTIAKLAAAVNTELRIAPQALTQESEQRVSVGRG